MPVDHVAEVACLLELLRRELRHATVEAVLHHAVRLGQALVAALGDHLLGRELEHQAELLAHVEAEALVLALHPPPDEVVAEERLDHLDPRAMRGLEEARLDHAEVPDPRGHRVHRAHVVDVVEHLVRLAGELAHRVREARDQLAADRVADRRVAVPGRSSSGHRCCRGRRARRGPETRARSGARRRDPRR